MTRWGDPRRSFDAAVGAARLGRPRPRRAAWWVGRAYPTTPQRNERAFALLRVDVLLRARPSLSIARFVPTPNHLRPFCAGWRPLTGFPNVPQFCTAGWLRFLAPLRSDDPDCPPLDSNLGGLLASSDSTPARLQTSTPTSTAPSTHTRLAFSAPFYRVCGRGLISHL